MNASLEQQKLLLYEDDLGLQHMLLPKLMELGFKQSDITFADQQAEAPSQLHNKDRKPQLIIVDYDPFNPRDFAKSFIQSVRSPSNPWADVPLIVITGSDGNVVEKRLQEYQVDAIIEYPFGEGVFESCVHELLGSDKGSRVK